MTTHDALPAAVLQRKAVVYVRQSTPQQVQSNLESQRRQYELVEVARRRGFTNIDVIDDDLGRTASGSVERPGFDRLVATLCAGQVGAVLCLEASRLARNGRDWHHLLELCGLVEARVIDLDGVYDPCRPNDRLLLGMKGSISEFELGIIRSRMYEAARLKAKRGELKISAPIGYAWDRHVGLGLDPDRRLQEVIRLVFHKFRELGSARQVLLWMASQNIHFPYPSDGRTLTSFEWRPIRYRNIISILKNPFYAGVYAYGKSEKRTAIVDGRARKSYGHRKPMGTWEVFIQDHHEGYISWAEYERNQALLAGNAYGRVGDTKSGRGGRALLAGLICCARCGRRLSVFYTGRYPRPVYRCEQPNVQLGQRRCLTVAGKRIDETIAVEMHSGCPGQPVNSLPRLALPGLPASRSATGAAPAGVPLRPQARQLAEHSRDRDWRAAQPMPGPAYRNPGTTCVRNRRLGTAAQCFRSPHQMDVHNRKGPRQNGPRLPRTDQRHIALGQLDLAESELGS